MNDDDDKTIFGQALPHISPTPIAPPKHQPAVAPRQIETPRAIAPTRVPVTPFRTNPRSKKSFWGKREKAGSIYAQANLLQSAATRVLILNSSLRVGTAHMHLAPLRDRLLRELLKFSQKCGDAGLPQQDIEDAQYALCAMADDIVLALPGTNQNYWKGQTLTLELFGDPDPFSGFFKRMNQAATSPSKRYHLLELMLNCMALGFEGKYRHDNDGPSTLVNLRLKLYERLRSVKARSGTSISHKWAPVILYGNRRETLVPLWILSGVAATMVIALFVSLASILTTEAQSAQNAIFRLHNPARPFTIQRMALAKDAPVIIYQAPATGQLERIANLFHAEIEAGVATLVDQGDYIIIRLGSILQFKAGLAELRTTENMLIKRIADSLNLEPGDIIIEGHSDNIPPSGAGRYKTNKALSQARAANVRDVLSPYLSNPARISAIGVGSNKPLDNANTPAARSKNRRVDILLRKQQLL